MSGSAVEVRRGGLVECEHLVDAAVVRDGELVGWVGDPSAVHFARSSLKPLQAHAAWLCGLEERFGITAGSRHLAIMSASHGATNDQRQAVHDLLRSAGLDERALRNGTHPPASAEGLAAMAGRQPTAVCGNCSGKHAGMLAACVAKGWDLASYLDLEHSLTQHVRATLAELMGLSPEAVLPSIDGCGLTTWATPLAATARAFAALPAEVAASMQAHPTLIGPPGCLDVTLMEAVPGLLAKSGAEAFFAVAVPAQRLGLTVKIRDGGRRAQAPAVIRLLDLLGLLDHESRAALAGLARPAVRALDGRMAGEIEPVFELHSA